ncbi:ATP-binding protein [Streptomyces tirandamycinicus]|uniref:ATP-binding protein n=1 Tax=Streptomyces tirandamycinicus TaxID=2174846 RepID=UPI00226ECE9C|nr:ATP-binding protein [Streptomyces tirandamycinicus]MCY0983258.1 ATP-binding protein [Streptomyces tirandamycinicus]
MTASATPPAIPAAPQPPVTVRVFLQRVSSTPRGARLARHLALHQLHSWGVPHGTEASETAAVLVAELAANAVTHGLVPGRDFELRLVLEPGKLIVDVSDPRGECRPPRPGGKEGAGPGAEGGEGEGGRGLVLVAALADRWSVLDRVPVGKTVRAELDLPAR